MNIAKQCTNDPTKFYYGTEMSPLRSGLSATGYDLNTVMKGYDKLNWIVKMKNNRKVWVRLVVPDKIVHEDIDDVKPDTIESKPNSTEDEIKQDDDKKKETKTTTKKKVVKQESKKEEPVVEKKMTNYNIFLAYRLNELKKKYADEKIKKTNKEVFTEVLQEWKNIDKKSKQFQDIMETAKEAVKIIYTLEDLK